MRVHLTEQPQEVLVTRKLDEIVHPDCVNIEPVSLTDYKNTNVYFAHLSGLLVLARSFLILVTVMALLALKAGIELSSPTSPTGTRVIL